MKSSSSNADNQYLIINLSAILIVVTFLNGNNNMRNEKRKLFAAFIDFRKSFGRIKHELLLFKLQRLGVRGLFYKN